MKLGFGNQKIWPQSISILVNIFFRIFALAVQGQKSRFVSFQTGVPWRSGHSFRVASWAQLGASSIPGVFDQLACAKSAATQNWFGGKHLNQ